MDQDKRLKEIEKAGAIEGSQLAQNEIARLTEEQKNNLLQEKQALSQASQQRTLISQAAEMGVDTATELSAQGQQSSISQPAINEQTQQILSKYGIDPRQKVPPRSITTTRSTSKQGQTTVENITNTTTTNHNVIKIIQPNIPVVQPNIAMRQGGLSNAKFKSWLQKANQQQEELANSQMNDYNRRERNLLRSTNSMMRKLQDLSKSIGKSLDPENMTNTISGSLKTMLFLFITTMIPIVWKPLMEKLSVFEANFRSFFGMELPGDLKGKVSEKIGGWKKALGIADGDIDKKGVPGAVLSLIKSSFQELLQKLEYEKQDRAKAIKRIEGDKPDSLTDIGGWLNYFGKIAVAALGGSEGQAKAAGKEISKEKVKEISEEEFELEGKKISMRGEFDEKGELRNEDSALKLTQSIANETTKETVDISKIQTSLEKLKSFSKDQNKLIPLSPEFVEKISQIVPQEKIVDLINKYQSKGEYKINDTDYVFTIRKSDYDPSSEYSIWDRIKEWSSAGADTFSKVGAGVGAAGAAVSTGGLGIVQGGALGYALGGLAGSLGGAAVGLGHGVGEAISAVFKAPGGQLSLVPLNSLSEKEKRNLNFHKNYAKARVQEVSPEFISELFGLAQNTNSFSSDNYIALNKTFTDVGKKTSVNQKYKEIVNDALELKEKKADLDKENTQTNRFSGTADLSRPQKDPIVISSESSSSDITGDPQKANVSTTQNIDETAKKIIQYLKDKLGLTQEQASGVAGNLYVESAGFNLSAEGDNGTSFGLAQWHNERKEALFKRSGTRTPTLEQQLDYLVYELNSTEKGALNALKQATSVKDSAYVFAKKFERPATGSDGLPLHFDRRWGYAENFYKKVIPDVVPTDINKIEVSEFTTQGPIGTSPTVAPIVENARVISNMNNSDEEKLKTIADQTKILAETTAISAQLDAIPKQQLIKINKTETPSQSKQQVEEGGWYSPT